MFCSSHFILILLKVKPTRHPLQYASSFVQLLCVVLVKSSDKLINYLMFVQTSIDMKRETHKLRLKADTCISLFMWLSLLALVKDTVQWVEG